ncbi:MAG: hypothetical protein JO038_03805 [Alphaproteobacteria bacterium]|nr:hypothetical protein [Alphaproteobacteria bacterium]
MRRVVKRAGWCAGAVAAVVFLSLVGLLAWPKPLFAYSLRVGKIVVASDRPIPIAGAERVLHDCENLLARSPLQAEGRRYHLYVTNDDWHHRLFFRMNSKALGISYYYGFGGNAFLSGADFEAGRIVHWGYVAPPPRTLSYFCAHELTHIVTGEHIGVTALLRLPEWVREGIADYAAMENRQSFEQLRDALGERPVDSRMMQVYGSYPRYRLLVSYFLDKKGWSADRLLTTKMTADEAFAVVRSGI